MKYYNNLKLFDFKLNLRLILSVPRKGNVPLRVMIVTVYTIVYFLLTNKYQYQYQYHLNFLNFSVYTQLQFYRLHVILA